MIVAWDNILSAHGSATASNGGSLGFFVSLYFINIMSSVVVMDHRFFKNTKTFKMTTKIDADESYASMGLNDNYQETVIINQNSNVTNDQEPK